MCVCMDVYMLEMCIYVCTCMHVQLCAICIYVYMYASVWEGVHICMYIYICPNYLLIFLWGISIKNLFPLFIGHPYN